jgi:hypothetical protein
VDPSQALDAMRFHPAVSCSELGKGRKMPAIVNVYRKQPDGAAIAIHVTYVGPGGSKPNLNKRKRSDLRRRPVADQVA